MAAKLNEIITTEGQKLHRVYYTTIIRPWHFGLPVQGMATNISLNYLQGKMNRVKDVGA